MRGSRPIKHLAEGCQLQPLFTGNCPIKAGKERIAVFGVILPRILAIEDDRDEVNAGEHFGEAALRLLQRLGVAIGLRLVRADTLDAMVDGTLGVAFFAPFSSARLFLPWRPIASSPIGMAFFSSAGATTIMNEFVWVWIPSLVVILFPWLQNRFLTRRSIDTQVLDGAQKPYELQPDQYTLL